jgi:hypothetical protein
MLTKLTVFAAALIVASPVFATAAGNSGGGSSASAGAGSGHSGSSGGGGHSGGGSGHSGGGGGWSGGHAGTTTLGGRGAAHAVAGNGGHAVGAHSARLVTAKHAGTEHLTPVTDMHHHRHHRLEPTGTLGIQSPGCFPIPVDEVWTNCFGPTKSRASNATHRST